MFSTGVSLVKADVQVTERGRLIPDLTKDDFVVLDDGKSQEIVYFGRDAEPLWILLLLDVSGSMRKHVGEMAASSRRALSELTPGDHVGIMLFSRRTSLHQEFTNDLAKVSSEIGSSITRERAGEWNNH